MHTAPDGHKTAGGRGEARGGQLTQDLLAGAGKAARHAALLHDASDPDHLLHRQVTAVLHCNRGERASNNRTS